MLNIKKADELAKELNVDREEKIKNAVNKIDTIKNSIVEKILDEIKETKDYGFIKLEKDNEYNLERKPAEGILLSLANAFKAKGYTVKVQTGFSKSYQIIGRLYVSILKEG